MHEGVNYYVPATALGVAVLAKFPALVRGWRNPLVRTVNSLLILTCAAFLFSAPPTIRFVNQLTGVSNFSAPLVYCIVSAYSCACVVLMEHWRADSRRQARARTRVRGWIAGFALVIAAVVVCFCLGEAPDERLVDFELYYATTPFIWEMLVIYIFANAVAALAGSVACWSWSLAIRRSTARDGVAAGGRSLRVGLVLLAVSFLVNGIFSLTKLVMIAACWTGREWYALERWMSIVISLNGMVAACGLLLPVVGPWLGAHAVHPLRDFAALRHLRRTVRPSPCTARQPVLLTAPWFSSPEQHLMHRMTDLHDWMLELRAYCSDDVREGAYHGARQGGTPEPEAVAIAFAAMFTAAADRRRSGSPTAPEQGVRASRALRSAETEYRDLMIRVSRALPSLAGAER
ncbi:MULTISPECIES: DUF6545 domain-containing protein [unclassified Streptomyces]|uniref:DUF6545 domain-containing protein n=1 Tax=Streptomyces TaxID=1883 RepID=UPI000DC7E9B6|nr:MULTISPECIES: DUF6545 domain-containing protein [unclassified Streptomyces]AWZ05998.1 hypothetical protein DRB89_16725 [Streptomyces sp. ICC4]AWZ13550.1 hypothetical protein DRB96_15960 [Streptomyces sp. ICC1]